MKRVRNLFDRFVHFDTLYAAYRRAKRGSRMNQDKARFCFHAETELLQLQAELRTGTYQPQPYRYFVLAKPKMRTVSIAAFRDRVVHHALVGLLEPIFERRFIHDSYATRKGKGTHAAIRQAQRYCRQNAWYLKLDIEKFFDSIQHQILLDILAKTIDDQRLLHTAATVIGNGGKAGIGLPIGNLTSQFFANVYLNPADQYIKRELKTTHFIRYMDDMVLFERDKKPLQQAHSQLVLFLHQHLGLRLKPTETRLNRIGHGLGFLGTRIFPATIRLQGRHLRTLRHNVRTREAALLNGTLTPAAFADAMGSYAAHLRQFNTAQLQQQKPIFAPEICL